MDKFFKPVHSPCVPEEMKPRKHHHHHHHRQDPQSHRYTLFEDTDRNTDESHGHHRHHKHGHYLRDSRQHESQYPHQTQQFPQSEEDEILYNNHETPGALYRASSSSLSSSSSSSFSSWYTDASANDPFSHHHAEQPQHSLSCSNIADVRRGFREDDGSEPIVFATVKHGKKSSVCSELQGISQKKGNHGFPSLDRGHSRSDEGLLQHNEGNLRGDRSKVHQINYGPLYKTASLNRSLAFSEEDILLGVSSGPKRAVSSSQLPSKGILKNKEPQPDIRKAKSMEVLSPRVSKGQTASGQKGKGNTQAEIEQARANFVQGKLQFSAFLDEITKQVMSPSHLTILGVKNNQVPGKMPAPVQTSTPVKPQLPPKKHRKRSGEDKEQPLKHSAQEKATCSNPGKNSYPDKLVSYAAKNHHGSPPPHHYRHSTNHNSHRGRDHKDRKMSPTEGPQQSGDRCGRYGPHLTDGTSTSPEPTQPKQRHHRKQQAAASYNQHSIHYIPQQEPQQVHAGPPAGPGLGSESSSSKSDSSRTRDSTATSHSSEQSCRHQTQHVGQSKKHKEPVCVDDHLQALQEENADLHQNLLQTVVCIESLEAELQRTRDELSHVKEKYKSLLETHSGTKQANSLLGEHLHIASESLSSERKYLQNRVLQLSSDLEDAHRTIAALENINVPCLIKELLEKHFDSTEAIKNFLKIPAPNSPSATAVRADCQSHTPKMEEPAHDKLMKSEAAPQRATAFSPFKQDVQVTGTESVLSDQHEGSHSPPFTVEDISTAIYKKMAASYAARSQPHYPQGQQQPPLGTSHTDTPPNLQQAQVGGSTWSGKERLEVTLLDDGGVDVTSTSAQQILDEFLKQLQPLKEPGGREQQTGQDWVGGAEHTGKVTD